MGRALGRLSHSCPSNFETFSTMPVPLWSSGHVTLACGAKGVRHSFAQRTPDCLNQITRNALVRASAGRVREIIRG